MNRLKAALLAGLALGAAMAVGPAQAVTYTMTAGAFGDVVSFTTAAPLTTSQIITPTNCVDGGVSRNDCQVFYRAPGSGMASFNGLSFNPTIADGFAVAFGAGETLYEEFATDATQVAGDHVVGSASLDVSDLTPPMTQTSYAFTDSFFNDTFTWTSPTPVTSPELIRPETCTSDGAVRYNCEIQFVPAGSPPVTLAGFQPIPTQDFDYAQFAEGTDAPFEPGPGDEFLGIGFDAGAFGADGVYKQGYQQLTVSGLGGGVPEPAAWMLMLLGFGGLGAAVRRRGQAARA